MTQEEFDKLVAKVGESAALKIKEAADAIQAKLDTKLADALKNNATKDEMKALVVEAAKEASESAKAALKAEYDEVLRKQGETIGELKVQISASGKLDKKSFTKALVEAFELKKDEMHEIIKGNQKAPFIIKVAVTMGEDNTIGSGATAVSLTQDTGIVSPIRRREEKYLAQVSVGTIGNNRALWIEETDEQGVPIFIGEGDGKIQISSLWVEQTQNVRKIAVYGKVTTELMDDLPQLVSYIRNSLMKRLSVKTESMLISGGGTGDDIKGATEYATAFSAGALAAIVVAPNEFDVLTALALQVNVANGIPNAVMIHPSTWAKMKTLKDDNGKPIWKDYVIPGSGKVVFEDMEIITSTAVTAGSFVGGDMTVLNVLYREQLTIQIGLDGNDFINNKKTILAESRLVQFASANDTPCLVTGVFEDAIEDLTVAIP